MSQLVKSKDYTKNAASAHQIIFLNESYDLAKETSQSLLVLKCRKRRAAGCVGIKLGSFHSLGNL